MKVKPIDGENYLRYWVESRSDPEHPHVVDLSSWNGYGQCSCKRWQCVIWPVIRDKTAAKHTVRSTCAHTRAAFRFFLKFSLEFWIKYHAQDKQE